MCFRINRNAKPWKQTIVFKVVKKTASGRLVSPDRYGSAGKQYVTGRRAHIKPYQEILSEDSWDKNDDGTPVQKTSAGIYVNKSLTAARRYAKMHGHNGSHKVIEMTVDPADFLYSAMPDHRDYKGSATYRAATPNGVVYGV
jgi:hypothetical protein